MALKLSIQDELLRHPSDVFARSKNVSKNYNVYRRQGLEQTKQRQWAKWQRIFSMMRFLRERERACSPALTGNMQTSGMIGMCCYGVVRYEFRSNLQALQEEC